MTHLIVGPVLGRVTSTSARVLIEVDHAGPLDISIRSPQGNERTMRVAPRAYEPLAFQIDNLLAGETYTLEVLVANGAERKATIRPIDGGNLSFASVSCYKLTDQNTANSAWKPLAEKAEAGDINVVLHMGDQIYADLVFNYWVKKLNETPAHLRDASIPAICQGYRDLYRLWWNHPPVQTVLRNASNLMIWDDHEIADDWGDKNKFAAKSRVEHLIAKCGWQVYREYQRQLWDDDALKRALGTHEGFIQRWGTTAVLFVDVRGGRGFELFNRHAHEAEHKTPYLGEAQWSWITSTLDPTLNDIDNLIVVTPVPLVFTPAATTEDAAVGLVTDDLHGHWIYRQYRPEQVQMLSLLRNWKQFPSSPRNLVLLGGDVHIGCKFKVSYPNGSFAQIVSGPVHKKKVSKAEKIAMKALLTNKYQATPEFSWKASSVTRKRNYGLVKVSNGSLSAELVKVG